MTASFNLWAVSVEFGPENQGLAKIDLIFLADCKNSFSLLCRRAKPLLLAVI